MILEENKVYTKDDMIKFFCISESVWKKREKREKLLLHLSNYYEYEIRYNKKDGRKRDYVIIRQIAPYEEYKSKRTVNNEVRDKAYENGIIETINEDNIQTARNVSRIIKDREDIKKLNHTENTCYEYTRLRMVKWFGTKIHQGGTKGIISEKIWCRLIAEDNYYLPLSDELISEFYDLFKQKRDETKEEISSIISDYQNGLINKDEMIEAIGYKGYSNFIEAQKLFKIMHGFTPIKVPVYEISAFKDEQKENEYEHDTKI